MIMLPVIAGLALLTSAMAAPPGPAPLTKIDAGSIVPVSGYCREPEPLRMAVLESIAGPADKQGPTERQARFMAVIMELLSTPEGHSGLPLCSRLPMPADAVALFRVLEPVPVSATEQVEIWAAWWADAGGKLYITVVARRADA